MSRTLALGDTMTALQASEELEVIPRQILFLIQSGKLEADKFGGRDWRVSVSSVEHYRQNRAKPGWPKRKAANAPKHAKVGKLAAASTPATTPATTPRRGGVGSARPERQRAAAGV